MHYMVLVIDIVCDIFGLDDEVLNNIIVNQGFGIGLNFEGNKTNASVNISNVRLSLEFTNKLQEEVDVVANRSEELINNMFDNATEKYIDLTNYTNDLSNYEFIQLDPQQNAGSIEDLSITSDNELLIQNKNWLGSQPFNKSSFYDDNYYIIELDVKKPTGNYPGKDLGIIIGDSKNYVHIFLGYYNIECSVNGVTQSQSGQIVNIVNYTHIKIIRTGDDWEVDYNNGEWSTRFSSPRVSIKNNLGFREVLWHNYGKAYIKNVKLTPLTSRVNNIIDKVYPVGYIYMSVSPVNPTILFGGRWERLKDRFLLAAGDNYSPHSIGGSATHKLTEAEMPQHTHLQNPHNHTQNSHNHSQNAHSHSQDSHYHKQANKYSSGTGSQGAYTYSQNRSQQDSYTDSRTPSIHSTTASNNATTATNNPTTATNSRVGGGQAHNNMPPYLVVNMWVRTA